MGALLYAANEGYLKAVEVAKIGDFESALLSYMHAEARCIDAEIEADGNWNDDREAAFKSGNRNLHFNSDLVTLAMAVGKEIRTKISSIQSTQKITSAMEMVAASKMRRAQDRMELGKPYARRMRAVMGHIANASPEYRHAYMQQREIKRVGYIVVSTDRGLVWWLEHQSVQSSDSVHEGTAGRRCRG
jgi:hypothetical protein